jgi:hypothetical protein
VLGLLNSYGIGSVLPVWTLLMVDLPFADVQELVGILANESAPVSRASPTEQNGSQKGGLLSAVRPSRVRGMLASRACRSSIMIGDALCKKEMEKVGIFTCLYFTYCG